MEPGKAFRTQLPSSDLGTNRDAAVTRVEDAWVRYVTEIERRSIEAGRSADKQLRLFYAREKERLDTLRDLERQIGDLSTHKNEKERALEDRLRTLQEHIVEREERLHSLDERFQQRQRECAEVSDRLASMAAQVTAVQRRLHVLLDEEREAKERVLLTRARGETQLKEYVAKFKAITERSNAIVAEAAEKVRISREVEREVSCRVDAIEAQLQAIAETTQPFFLSSSSLLFTPRVEKKRPQQHAQRLNLSLPKDSAGPSPLASAYRRRTDLLASDSSPPVVSGQRLHDLSAVLCELEEQFRDSLVEATVNEMSFESEKMEESREERADEENSEEVFEF